jgi:hypothetical protein
MLRFLLLRFLPRRLLPLLLLYEIFKLVTRRPAEAEPARRDDLVIDGRATRVPAREDTIR